ncbi:hypothetical protein THIOM_004782 [Candidatus Thiomargarita nelsonii]|uniref:Uncharacterized protein n=1 Tax=Candidatus Thiomargarita nelsonii TaxID=1003181 RepID=A0A176RUZ7_9GAMM|nr:hypothetical protein THIOM_004782 [Candidatus Thiomargarita nelsonii]
MQGTPCTPQQKNESAYPVSPLDGFNWHWLPIQSYPTLSLGVVTPLAVQQVTN